jgi:glycolate oxidase iron-sulfur subunit
MQTWISADFMQTQEGKEADAILRSCVHCGFCNAACPTYTLLGNELDGPRGRIYQIKGLLEGQMVTSQTQSHLDRCLTCRACETACPSGVQYAKLIDIGRAEIEKRVPRSVPQRWIRRALRWFIPSTGCFGLALKLARIVRPVMPSTLKPYIPTSKPAGIWPQIRHSRHMLILSGCVQPALEPGIDSALARLLDRHGISAIPVHSGCCGAVSHHLTAPEQTRAHVKTTIDAVWPYIETGIEAIIMTASGCGAMLQDYGHLFLEDPEYATKAARLTALYRDPVQIVEALPIDNESNGRQVAFQAPCSLVNALKLEGRVETVLKRAGYVLLPVSEQALCCGSAGTYSILQPELAGELRERKLRNLQLPQPEIIATANIGCLIHLNMTSKVPVVHWLSLLETD